MIAVAERPGPYIEPVPLRERLLSKGDRVLRHLKNRKDAVLDRQAHYESLDDDTLKKQTALLKERYKNLREGQHKGKKESLDALLPDAFAVFSEALWREKHIRPYEAQIMGAVALHEGNIAEMNTGEGKTYVAAMAAYLESLTGEGVHVVTANDYLAKRDTKIAQKILSRLDITVGCILPNRPDDEHRDAYSKDITYGTADQFAFDFLKDNMVNDIKNRVQRGHASAIVDEADAILIDEARTPHILSEPSRKQNLRLLNECAGYVKDLQRDVDYEVDETKKTVFLTPEGITKMERTLEIDNLYELLYKDVITGLNDALKAKELHHRDKDYIVEDGEVILIDEFTGRKLHGRRFNEGIHEAIEAKEGLEIHFSNQPLASITMQNYFRMYERLSGLTGTARTNRREFEKVYKTSVVTIPPHKPLIRDDYPDEIYKDIESKFTAVVKEAKACYDSGQPILIGTIDVENSERLSQMLTAANIPHTVLNAKQDKEEASIIAQAGRLHAVTIATNMAGRGTDILLGGDPDFLAEQEFNALVSSGQLAEGDTAAFESILAKKKQETKAEEQEVIEKGGLYVLGTERHESIRIDRQLMGRGGRQGQPGKSRFMLSYEDKILNWFGPNRVMSNPDIIRVPDGVPLNDPTTVQAIAATQGKIEVQQEAERKELLKFDETIEAQRKAIYRERDKVLDGEEDIHSYVRTWMKDVVNIYVTEATRVGGSETWDLEKLWKELGTIQQPSISVESVVQDAGKRSKVSAKLLRERLTSDMYKTYEILSAELGDEARDRIERQTLLWVTTQRWKEHITEVEYVQDDVELRRTAFTDIMPEFNREVTQLYEAMIENIHIDSVRLIFQMGKGNLRSRRRRATATS